ncbi:MAG: membrane protein insertion efficiency factor YidD [Candidatus Hydrogenedentes bacterium]|nr:membrane protein insertion efficiency factor YidD [Candidatus Hydrogenedentota bacterium]
MKRAALMLIRIYRGALSPWLPAACRYEPTCSEYARIAGERFGAGRGS